MLEVKEDEDEEEEEEEEEEEGSVVLCMSRCVCLSFRLR